MGLLSRLLPARAESPSRRYVVSNPFSQKKRTMKGEVVPSVADAKLEAKPVAVAAPAAPSAAAPAPNRRRPSFVQVDEAEKQRVRELLAKSSKGGLRDAVAERRRSADYTNKVIDTSLQDERDRLADGRSRDRARDGLHGSLQEPMPREVEPYAPPDLLQEPPPQPPPDGARRDDVGLLPRALGAAPPLELALPP